MLGCLRDKNRIKRKTRRNIKKGEIGLFETVSNKI